MGEQNSWNYKRSARLGYTRLNIIQVKVSSDSIIWFPWLSGTGSKLLQNHVKEKSFGDMGLFESILS